MINESEALKQAILVTAELMVASAKTAPKARGVDNIVSAIITERSELEKLAGKMRELAGRYGAFFERDAESVLNSDAVVLIGCRLVEMRLTQPDKWSVDASVVNSLVNLGIAIGSAVRTASILNIDNRVMFSMGVAARELGLLDADIVYGIPLSARSKNIYFDRVFPRK